jgi:hypothetical protein
MHSTPLEHFSIETCMAAPCNAYPFVVNMPNLAGPCLLLSSDDGLLSELVLNMNQHTVVYACQWKIPYALRVLVEHVCWKCDEVIV